MKVDLKVFARLILLNILPAQGDIFTLKAVRTLREMLSFTDEELTALDFHYGWKCKTCEDEFRLPRTESPAIALNIALKDCCRKATMTENVTWKDAADVVREFEFNPRQHEILAIRLKELNAEKKLTMDHFPLYESFVGEVKE